MHLHDKICLAFAIYAVTVLVRDERQQTACRECEDLFRYEEERLALFRDYVEQVGSHSVFRAAGTEGLARLNQHMDILDSHKILCKPKGCLMPDSLERIQADVCAIETRWRRAMSHKI